MAKSLSEIKAELQALPLEERVAYMKTFQSDTRKGVQQLIAKTEKSIAAAYEETKRLEKMLVFEHHLKDEGVRIVAGIDEVGRGPLAGPVVASVVILKDPMRLRGINDSKKVSLKNRERLYAQIMDEAIEVAIGMASCEEIDTYNILNATKLAMKRAIEKLQKKPEHLLIDAVHLDDIDIEQTSIIKGDEKSISIAAASIIAKVTRDRMMIDYETTFPGYDFAGNKGYGTAAHYVGLNKLGICSIHRKTFVKDFL